MDKRRMLSAPKGPPASDRRPAVVIYRSPLFNASETFVRAHAPALARYRPLLAGQDDKGNIPPPLRGSVALPRGIAERIAARFGHLGPLAERLRGEEPRLVHAHFGTDGLAALTLAAKLGVPLVTTLHGYDVTRDRRTMLLSGRLSWMRYALLRERLLRGGDLFLAVSEAIRQKALAQGFPAERTQTHYLGVDLARFAGDGAPEPGLVLHVGRLVEKKGTATLLRAMAQLPAARLVVIGDGPERARLQRQAAPLGERVRFLGALPEEEVAGWMRRAWLLAVPSVTAADGDAEGLPTVLVEAAAAGLPAVGTRHSGIPEAIDEGQSGLLVGERDVEGLAAQMGALLGSPDLRQRMGANARRLAEEKFDAGRQTARLEAVYDRLLGQTRS